MSETLQHIQQHLEEYRCALHMESAEALADPNNRLVINACCRSFQRFVHSKVKAHITSYYEKAIRDYFNQPG